MPYPIFLRAAQRRTGEWLRRLRELRYGPGSVLLGRYRIVRRLGMGSYGVAYLCEDHTADRSCVLKRVRPIRGGRRRAAAIFASETGILADLCNSSIPCLYEKYDGPREYIFTMSRMEGDTLEELLFRDGRVFTEQDSLLVVKRMLPLLAYIHRMGIIHRDISIANVLLSGDDVRIVDFGLARRIHPGIDAEADDDLMPDDPEEKRLRRQRHVTGDFYGTGHLLLYLLYSGFDGQEREEMRSWDEELRLHPQTIRLLRRLLMTEQPYDCCEAIERDIDDILLRISSAV